MSFDSSSDHQDYRYHHVQNYGHYISDGCSVGGGDESNFWCGSPRSDSPSPNSTQNPLVGPYHIYTPVAYPSDERQIYRTGYQTISSETDCVSSIPTPFVRVVKRRTTANKKERRRTQSINNAYADLRDCIPNVPADTKLSKIKTLRLATSYISYLTRALESDDPAGGFKAELGSITRKSNSNPVQVNDCSMGQISSKGNISEDMNCSNGNSTGSSSRSGHVNGSGGTSKAKGRTGWPQHVWALELKQEQGM